MEGNGLKWCVGGGLGASGSPEFQDFGLDILASMKALSRDLDYRGS